MQTVDGMRGVRAGKSCTYYNVPNPMYKSPVYIDKNVMKRVVISIHFLCMNKVNHKGVLQGHGQYCDESLEDESRLCAAYDVITVSTCRTVNLSCKLLILLYITIQGVHIDLENWNVRETQGI